MRDPQLAATSGSARFRAGSPNTHAALVVA